MARNLNQTPILTLLAFAIAAGGVAKASEAEDFYKGRAITLVVGSSAGGGYDSYSRLLARHMPRHLPAGGNVIVQNMPGASGVRAVNYLYNLAPRDGTVFGIGQRATLVEPVYGGDQVKIDPRKLSWLGGLNTEWSVGIANPASGLTSIDVARTRDFPVSSSGAASDGSIYAAILNNVLGTRFKVITGYPGTAEEQLATERGEVAGRIGWAWGSIQATARDKIEAGTLKPFVLLSPTPLAGIDAPLARDFAKTDEDRAVLDFAFAPQLFGRPFFAPPEIPAERLALLQKAFAETTRDNLLLEEAERARLDISYVSPDDLQALAESLYATPIQIVERAKRARQANGF